MTLNEYQVVSGRTRLPTADAQYIRLNLVAEAGEFIGKFAKWQRDGFPVNYEGQAAKELGDILWHVAQAAQDLGFDLEEIAEMNIEKLQSRMIRGTIGGSGDDR